jgi:hypothetical protein
MWVKDYCVTSSISLPSPHTPQTHADRKYRRLRIFNGVMGAIHLAQAMAVLALANDFSLPVTATFLQDAPGASAPVLDELFQFRLAWGVAAFLLISAAAHWIIVSPGMFAWYRHNLERNRNYARWVEYSISASLMVALIALLPGSGDVGALVGIFGVNASMILFGLLMEHYEEPGTASWLPYWFGVIAGIFPWLVIALYLWSPTTDSSPPVFVYGIFVSLFIFFNSFAVNMVLQYKRVGPWRNYLFGESVYIVLSLISKSALAWQVFSGTLAS